MSEAIPFLLAIELETPAIINGMTLDGVLGGILYETRSSDDWEEELDNLPLMKTDIDGGARPLYHASRVQILPDFRLQDVIVGKRIDAKTIYADDLAPSKRNLPKIDAARGLYKNVMTSYVATSVSALYFFGVGDPDRVCEIISRVPSIGARRHSGFGMIARNSDGSQAVSWAEVEGVDVDRFGLVDRDGLPARPVPVSTWRSLSNAEPAIHIETWHNPYHDKSMATLCVVPKHDWHIADPENEYLS